MKKKILGLLVALMLFVSLIGCTGFNAGTAVNAATDVAFAAVLISHPESKPVIVAALKSLKVVLTKTDITYDQLVIEIAKQFGGKYAVIGIILTDYFAADKPIFETYLPLLNSYKAALNVKLDRFILLASI